METSSQTKKLSSSSETTCETKNRVQNKSSKFFRIWKWFCRNFLYISIPSSLITGVTIGFIIRLTHYNDDTVMLITFPGYILMRPFSLIFLPLIISSIIPGVAQMGDKSISTGGKIGRRTLIYYMTTTVIAIFLGMALITLVHPGDSNLKSGTEKSEVKFKVSSIDTFLDLLRNLFPENLLRACIQREKTVYIKVPVILPENNTISYKMERKIEYESGTNIVGIMMFSLIFGVVLGRVDSGKEFFIKFLNILNDVVMKIISLLLYLMPISIISLMIGRVMTIKNLLLVTKQLGLFVLTVNTGLLIHGFVILPLIYYFVTRKNPLLFIRGILNAILTAFGTSNSTATLPVTMKCLEENNGIDKRITRLILPIGATINMDGTALYEAVVAIFIAQINGIEFNFGKMIIVSITATIGSIGAGTTSGGLVTMILVLDSVGLPHGDLFLVILVDWCL